MRMFKYSFYKQELLQLNVNNFYVNELDRVHQIIYRYEKRVSQRYFNVYGKKVFKGCSDNS